MTSRSLRDRLAFEQVVERLDGARGGHAPLPASVAVAEGHGAVGQGLAVDGDAERRAGLVLPAIRRPIAPFSS